MSRWLIASEFQPGISGDNNKKIDNEHQDSLSLSNDKGEVISGIGYNNTQDGYEPTKISNDSLVTPLVNGEVKN